MEFDLVYQGPKCINLPRTGETVCHGEACTVVPLQLRHIRNQILGARPRFRFAGGADETKAVKVARDFEIRDESGEVRTEGDVFEANVEWLVRRIHLILDGRLVEADSDELEPDGEGEDDEPVDAADDDLEALTKNELWALTKEAGLDGDIAYSTATKGDLVDALTGADGDDA